MTDSQAYALIFDMDGVLIDNTAYQARAFQALFREHGLTTNARRLLERLNGMPATAILKTVFRNPVPAKDLELYAEQREFLYRTLYWNKRRELTGLRQFLQAARDAGFKLGLGTGSGADTLAYIIDHLDLRRFFDVVTSASDVKRGKPHQETYVVVAQKLGVPPERCVVFEDAVLGEQSAYRAGMRCVCLDTSVPGEKFQKPLKVIRDFTQLKPTDIPELLTQQPDVPKPDAQLAKRKYAKLS